MINKQILLLRNQKGLSALFLLSMAGLAIMLFFVITDTGPFKNKLLSTLFPKSPSQAASSPTDWPQFQHDPQHTGRTSVQVNPNYQANWIWMDKTHIVKNFVNGTNKSITDGFADKSTFKSTVIFAGQMQPVMSGGKVFFGATNGVMYAVNSSTGDNLWDFTTGGPILHSAADDGAGTLITGSMDGKVYGLNDGSGALKWTYQTGAGISSPPVLNGTTVYIGSRDGSMYAIDTTNGSLKWKYDTRDPSGPFNKAPIISAAALSEDGSVVMFGAENMYFYALDANTGTEKWVPKKLIGQSFQYSWPVIKGTNVIVRTVSSLGGTEYLMESVLDSLPANPDWQTQEKPAVQNWLAQNPGQRSIYVFNVNTGNEPFEVAMSRVSAENMASFPPVVDGQGRVLTYWRSRTSTFFTGGTFGSNYCPDLSGLDMTTGDRIKLSPATSMCPELDNGFAINSGGNYLYLENHFRGTIAINQTTGALTRITHSLSVQDCGNFRGYPYQIIYYGNDNGTYQPGTCTLVTDPRPPADYDAGTGWSGVSIGTSGATNMFYSNETNINAIVGISGSH